jgi:hypothetical protein
MKIKITVKAGGISMQHNQKVASGLKVKTNVKAGDGTEAPAPKKITTNHNQTMARGMNVKTGMKAGEVKPSETSKPGAQ